MADAAGLVLIAGSITAANELVFVPAISHGPVKFNWRIIPATVVFAVATAGLEQIAPKVAVGLAATMLVTVLFVRFGNEPAPLENLFKAIG